MLIKAFQLPGVPLATRLFGLDYDLEISLDRRPSRLLDYSGYFNVSLVIRSRYEKKPGALQRCP